MQKTDNQPHKKRQTNEVVVRFINTIKTRLLACTDLPSPLQWLWMMLRSQAVDENWGWSATIVTTSLRSSEQLGVHADKSHGFLAQRHPVQATKVQQSFYKAALSLTPWWLGCWIARTRPMIRRLNNNNWNRSDPAVLLFGSLLNSRNHRNHFLLDCFVHCMIILAIIHQHDIITRNQGNSVWRLFLVP